jgi:hypothetical protein
MFALGCYLLSLGYPVVASIGGAVQVELCTHSLLKATGFKPSPLNINPGFQNVPFRIQLALLHIVFGAFFGARCGWVQHEGGHNSLTGDIWMDKRIQAATCGFGLATSGDMWNQMHNKHHATPQKVRHDMDLAGLYKSNPVDAFSLKVPGFNP